MLKPKKTPQRKCTGCQQMKNKRELIRVVRRPDGGFELDATGKQPGRGAYMCPSEECFKKARKQKGLERSFKCAIPADVYDLLMESIVNADG